MIYVVDTNVILYSILLPSFDTYFRVPDNDLIISVVTEGELQALAIKRGWGKKKINQLNNVLPDYVIYPLKVEALVNAYAQIDAYSQGLLKSRSLPKGISARNMGKMIFG